MKDVVTWTAGELVNQLRALDPSTPVYVCAEGDDLGHPVPRARRWPFGARKRPIVRARVRVVDGDRFAYIQCTGGTE